MINLFYRYFMNSLNITFVIVLLILLEPFLKRRFSAVCLYRVWLILLLGLLIPIRFELTDSLFSIRLPRISIENRIFNNPNTLNTNESSEFLGTNDLNSSKNQILPNYNTTDQRAVTSYPELFHRQFLILLHFLRQNYYSLICGFWIVGILFVLIRNTIRYINCLQQLKRFVSPIKEGHILSELQECQHEVYSSYKRLYKYITPAMYYCSIITSPITIGIFCPVILLPKEPYTKKDLHFLILHELIHIYRRDSIIKLIRVVTLALNWFNPFCYILFQHLDNCCEVSCDEIVLYKAPRADCMDYSKLLLRSATPLSKHKVTLITNFCGGKRTMKKRILTIMNQEKKHPGKLLLTLVAVIVITTVFISAEKDPVTANAGILNSINTAGTLYKNKKAAKISQENNDAVTSDTAKLNSKDLRKEVADFASQKVDVAYTWGGNEFSTGVDCGGFVQAVYKEYNYDLPRTSREQLEACEEVSLDNLLAGDLIFYTSSNDNKVNHVAIYLGNDKVVHAKNKRVGVTIEDIDYRKPYTAGRVITDH